MPKEPRIFDLALSPVPLLNVRQEFALHYRMLKSDDFREQIARRSFENPIHAGYLIWGGPPEMLLNWFLQRTIIGVEAYIPSAAFIAGSHYGRLTGAVINGVRDPFSLNCGGIANTIYNCVPGLIDPDFRMKRSRGRLWKLVSRFYREVRNPLFHGSQLATEGHRHDLTLGAVLRAFDLFVKIYQWADWWIPPQRLNMFGNILISAPPKITELEPERYETT